MSDIDEKQLRSVALFPLPNMVLFPGAMLPLHIFEPRYLEMVRDTLDGSGLLVMAHFLPGYESDYQGRPPVHTVCGLGRIVASEQLPDGRYSLLLQGVGRVAIDQELAADRAYRLVRVRSCPDEEPSTEPAPLRDELVSVCELLCRGFGADGQTLLASLREATSASELADLAAANLIANPERRQALLEIFDPAERLRRVREHVATLVITTSQDPERLN